LGLGEKALESRGTNGEQGLHDLANICNKTVDTVVSSKSD
jgi:hypothetical protein